MIWSFAMPPPADRDRRLIARGCAIGAAVVFLLPALAVGSVRPLSSWFARRLLTPPRAAELDRAKATIIHFPPEWKPLFQRPPQAVYDAVRRAEGAEWPFRYFLDSMAIPESTHPLSL